MSSRQVFISYSETDKEFVDRLRQDLLNMWVSSWVYEKDIRPGDSIPGSVGPAIAKSDYFFLVLSVTSVSRAWIQRETDIASSLEIEKKKPHVVILLLHNVDIPPLLRHKRYVDFSQDYSAGWKDLCSLFPTNDLRILRLGGATGTGFHLLKLFVAKFRESYPDLPVDLRANISEELINSVSSRNVENNLDAAVVGRIPADSYEQSVAYKEVFRDVSVLTVFPNHPLWGTESLSEESLVAHLTNEMAFISRPKGSGLYEATEKYLLPMLGNANTERLLNRFVVHDLESTKKFVSEGRGISIMPQIIVREDVLSGKMWAVRLPGDVSRSFYGIWASHHPHSTVAEDFIGLLKRSWNNLTE